MSTGRQPVDGHRRVGGLRGNRVHCHQVVAIPSPDPPGCRVGRLWRGYHPELAAEASASRAGILLVSPDALYGEQSRAQATAIIGETYSGSMPQARYDAVADFYVAGFDSTDDGVSQALLGLLGPVTGLRVLDVACGHGRLTRELARRGATVAGVDLSGRLIERAQQAEHNEPLGIHYVHADVTAASLGGASFDAVTCSFGLSDIDDLAGAVAAVSHALQPGGRFVFSILHPCFPGGKDISGSWPPTSRYYDEQRWAAQDALSTLRRQVGANHRMLSTYLNTLRAHDLWLDQLAEPWPEPDWDQAHQADRTPVYLVARSVKMITPPDAP